MGNKNSCCAWRGSHRSLTDGKSNHWSNHDRGLDLDEYPGHDPGGGMGGGGGPESLTREDNGPNLQHISEREPDDLGRDPSVHPSATTLFIEKSKRAIQSEWCSEKKAFS
jgi:hypothetical protein